MGVGGISITPTENEKKYINEISYMKKKFKILDYFHIPDPMYNKPVTIIYNCSNNEFHNYLENRHKNTILPRGGVQIAKYVFITEGGKNRGHYCYVWVEHADPLSPYDISTISHELAHHTFFVLESSGVQVIPGKSEEAFTYYHTYMLEQALWFLKKERKKQRVGRRKKAVKGGCGQVRT